MDLLDKLNTPQRGAVLCTDGPLLILAGAGSGKTRVVTHRIAYLIKMKNVPPTSIMAVTFTNKAADEMKKRLTGMIGKQGKFVFVKTFHSAAVFILRKYGTAIGIPENFSIYDSRDQEELVKEIILEMRLDPKKIKPFSIMSKISEIKDKSQMGEGGNDILALMPKIPGLNFPYLYEEYHARLKSRNALDFNDLLVELVNLLRRSPETLEKLQQQWKYFMIDEYQDTNTAQYLIVKYLAEKTRNVCVVGDDDQSIYSWRGADIRNILNFEKDYPEANTIRLEHNYRSTKEILDAASCVITQNTERMGKAIISARGPGFRPVWCTVNNEYGEAEYVVRTMSRMKREEGFQNKDMALFYRTNAQSRVFEGALRRENISYRIIGGLKFYDRKEIKDILCYLKFIVNLKDTGSLLRIINTPARGIGPKAIEQLRDTAYKMEKTEWEIIDGDIPIAGKISKGISEFKKAIRLGIDLNSRVPLEVKLSSLLIDVIDASGYRQALYEENTDEAKNKISNIDEFINSVFEFEMREPDGTLSQFLQEVMLMSSEEDPDNSKDNSVTLMTVHCAKGLEYPVVFLTGMEEGLFPHGNCIEDEKAVEEERRLCYVGITRAMDRLFMTNAELRRSYAGVDYREASRFLFEIETSLMERVYFEDPNGGMAPSPRERQQFNNQGYGSTGRSTAPSPSTDLFQNPVSEAAPVSASKYRPKDRVIHPKYGIGRVVVVEGSGDNLKLTIVFETAGLKSFLEKYTPLEKV
jgi:DNA helicase-2/ATP-dependent DNA helicase PcrA